MSSPSRNGRQQVKARTDLVALVIGIPNMMRSQFGPTIAQVLRPAGWGR